MKYLGQELRLIPHAVWDAFSTKVRAQKMAITVKIIEKGVGVWVETAADDAINSSQGLPPVDPKVVAQVLRQAGNCNGCGDSEVPA